MGIYLKAFVFHVHVVLLVSLASFICVGAKSTGDQTAVSGGLADSGSLPLMLTLAGLGVGVCGIMLLLGCVDWCRRQSGFKDFSNEDAFSTEIITTPPGPSSEFTMYPPVENTPEPAMASPVYFEPLPDISTKVRTAVSNVSVLRPRVASLTAGGRERLYSDGSFEEVPQDSVQDKLKLQSLLSNSRSQLPRGQLQYIKELGSGWFGKVLQGEGQKILPGHKKTKVVIQMLREDSDSQEQLIFLQEAAPYREIDHPNVLKLLGQCVETTPFLVVLELCPFGDLKTYLRSHRIAMESFNQKGLLLKFASDMAAGLQGMHQQNFVHHDFAARNCLLASDLSVKVGDYGISEEVFKEDYHVDKNGDLVPIRWLAPESMQYASDGVIVKRITKEANIWSFGVALWEVLTFGGSPYADLTDEHVLRLVVKERSVKLPKPDVPLSHMERLNQLLQICWSDPASRASVREIRIMLLHLLSRKGTMDSSAFDQKWNQLLPKRQPQITQVPDPTIIHAESNGSVQTVATFESDFVPPGTVGKPSQDFDSKFMELNASTLALAGSFSSRSGMSLEQELSAASQRDQSHDLQSPTNEISLEAELNAINARSKEAVNEMSLEAELAGVHQGQRQVEIAEVHPVQTQVALADVHQAERETEHAGVDEVQKEELVKEKSLNEKPADPNAGAKDKSILNDAVTGPVNGNENDHSEHISDQTVQPDISIILHTDKAASTSQTTSPEKSDSVVVNKSAELSPGALGGVETVDLLTSTPKSDTADSSSSTLQNTTNQSSESQGSSKYYTALSSQLSVNTTTDTTAKSILDEPVHETAKFAAMLQTVAPPSFDYGDDFDPISLSGNSSFDRSVDSPFDPSVDFTAFSAGTKEGYQQVSLGSDSAQKDLDKTVTPAEDRLTTSSPRDDSALLDFNEAEPKVEVDNDAALISVNNDEAVVNINNDTALLNFNNDTELVNVSNDAELVNVKTDVATA